MVTFDKCESWHVTFAGEHRKNYGDIQTGDDVRLRINGLDVIVRNVQLLPDDRYRGTFQGCEDNRDKEDHSEEITLPDGLALWQVVEFTRANIFRCY